MVMQIAFVEMPKFHFDLNVYGGDGALTMSCCLIAFILALCLKFQEAFAGVHHALLPNRFYHG